MLQFSTRFSLVIKCYFLYFILSSINASAQYFQPTKDLSTYTSIPLQANPVTLGTGDFNGDGKPDVVTGNYSNESTDTDNLRIAILLNTGFGQFASPVFYPVTGEPNAIVVTDLNQDAKPDLVVSLSYGRVTILLGKGDGTFQTPFEVTSDYLTAQSLATGDFNNDGKTDIIFSNYYSTPHMTLLLGDGSGKFSEPIRFDVGQEIQKISVGDLNGDHKPDLLAISIDKLYTVLGNGNGTFQSPKTYTVPYDVRSIDVKDFNQDGKADILVSSNYYLLQKEPFLLFLGDGNGGMSTPVSLPFFGGVKSTEVADFNGDGSLDICASTGNQMGVLLNRGNGTFEFSSFLSTPAYSRALTAGDFNGDGALDILSSYRSNLSVHLGNGKGNFGTIAHYPLAGENPLSVATGDLNEDGTPDIVTADSYLNTISVLNSNAYGSYSPPVTYKFTGRLSAVTIGDFNRDGHLDLAATDIGTTFGISYADRVNVFMGKGNGTFDTHVRYFVDKSPSSIIAIDLNKDGILDLVTTNAVGNNVAVLVGNPDGTFQQTQYFAVGSSPSQVKAFDVNKDGLLDLLVVNRASKSVSVLMGMGDRQFAPAVNYSIDAMPRGLTLTDVNQDGFIDVVTSNETGTSLSVLLGTSQGGFSTGIAIATLENTYAITTTDANFDGKEDLLVTHHGSNTISLLLAQGNGSFAVPVQYVVRNSPRSIALEDFDKDGRKDVIVANYASYDVNILYSRFEAPTPVRLLSFTATRQSETVRLDWATASEKDAALFLVERSREGKTFEAIATVKAAGNRGSRYVAYDHLPLKGLNYYRLTQVDEDGKKNSYRPVSVRMSGTDLIYPNPSNGEYVEVEALVASEIQLTTLQGQRLLFSTESVGEQSQSLRIYPKQVLKPGVYLLRVAGVTHKWLVQ
ncbi:T9SS type A sorting domain-containing protein [Siphonobacter curvatus]|uniref:Secretion system C-terminal sorting domain-containing protein n=1 Tax=Siphonobacter curvatus TaxID=2094562 RepID=A0A2S7IPV1_9BACT|nr:T9SS type A sorting domain-containing protein [Siphonobacter curvatus]PQA59658.1 hypothetical protein C5O19_08500 [Siphonobacter curvatus]